MNKTQLRRKEIHPPYNEKKRKKRKTEKGG